MKTVKDEMKRRKPLYMISGKDGRTVEVSREVYLRVQRRMMMTRRVNMENGTVGYSNVL